MPFLLVVLIFAARLTWFNLYRDKGPDGYFAAPAGLRLNIDATAVGTCAGDFPEHFVAQSRCGQYYLSRPGYSALIFVLSRPAVWAGELLPERAWKKMPVEKTLLPYAASVGTAVFLNLFLAFATIYGIRRLFSPYLPNWETVWLAQILYASAYGTSAHLGDAIAEIFQHCLMIWVPILFRDSKGWARAIPLGFAATGKEILCSFAGGFIEAWKYKRLDWKILFLPVPLLGWFFYLKVIEGVVFQKYYLVSDWDYGTWYLVIFKDPALFQARLWHVLSATYRSFLPAFLPLIWIGGIAYLFLWRRIPLLIHAQFLMGAGQFFAMGFVHPRILYNFLFIPFIYSTALLASLTCAYYGLEKKALPYLGLLSALLGLGAVALVFSIH